MSSWPRTRSDEYGIEPDALVAEYGPDALILGPRSTLPSPPRAARRGHRGRSRTWPTDPAVARPGDGTTAHRGAAGSGRGCSLADALRAVRAEAEQARSGRSGGGTAAATAAAQAQGAPPSRETVGVPYVREEQEARAAEAERQLARLGKVNPLALEEYAALQERHQFLATQLEDLRKTRRDLLMVVKEVDDRVQEVFASAYADTAREFEGLFARLFPGGAGRLILTEPDDMLTTGIEIEARPPGKKVKRLSLLSGGERSLTAIAYLFAIFKARPSPFYVLDEVEAALDDTNLQRLLRGLRRAAGELAAHRHHPPAAHHGGGRRALRRLDARRRRVPGDQPARPRARARLTGRAPTPRKSGSVAGSMRESGGRACCSVLRGR